MTKSGVVGLGYLGVAATDMAAWSAFVTRVFGMQVVPRSDGGLDLRIDDAWRRIALYPGDKDRVLHIGWEVAEPQALAHLTARLSAAGIGVREGTSETLRERGVDSMVQFEEPHTGVSYELFCGVRRGAEAFRPSRPISGYKTGAEGLGHVMLAAADRDAAIAFHRDLLGFEISDHIDEPPIHATFMHCNSRHHSLAIVDPFGEVGSGDFGHLMLEAMSLDDVGAGHDAVLEDGLKLHLSFGKHSNDHMHSFYVYSPGGFPIEYGYGGRAITPNWEAARYDSIRIWGHKFLG